MRKILDQEIKKRELSMLIEISLFCEQNHLKYYLSGGTLLGAVRHKGVIPWDDDIDICMPRKDYITLITSLPKTNSSYVIKSNLLNNFKAPFSKLVDLKTTIDNKYNSGDTVQNLWIDIFPVDGLPDDMASVRKIYKECKCYRNMLLLAGAKLGEGTTAFRKYSKYVLKPMALLYGQDRIVNKIEKIAQRYPYDQCNYVGAVTWGLYGIGERMCKKEFETSVEVEFEGHKFPTFSCWDSYLKGLYGNYMELPPVERRKNHDMIVYIKD